MRTIQQQLLEKGLTDSLEQPARNSNIKTSERPKERLSSWELAELMGSNRDTFRRAKGGAIRRR